MQYFEADFLWKVSLKILNSGIILKTFTHVSMAMVHGVSSVQIFKEVNLLYQFDNCDLISCKTGKGCQFFFCTGRIGTLVVMAT